MQNNPQSLGTTSNQKEPIAYPNQRIGLVAVVLLFFLFGFVTVLNDLLIPHLKGVFQLSQTEAMLVQTAFFGAYFLISVPAGYLLKRTGTSKGIVFALIVAAIGLSSFITAANTFSYFAFLGALFVLGSGIAILQVAANPYLSLLGPESTASIRLNLAGFLNSSATTFAPLIVAPLLFIDANLSAEEKASLVKTPYWFITLFVLVLAATFYFLKLPKIKEEVSTQNSTSSSKYAPHLIAAAMAIFVYVGVEVAVGSVIVNYLSTSEMGAMGELEASKYVSAYWGALLVGRFLGVLFLNKTSSEKALLVVSAIGLGVSLVLILAEGLPAIGGLLVLGLCHSIMWPCIFPLGIKNLGADTAKGSGLMISMVVGGAIIPPLQGVIIDSSGYPASFLLWALLYLYLIWFAQRGHKLTNITGKI